MKQVRLKRLLEDPVYRAWFSRKPPAFDHTARTPWRVYVQRTKKGPWAKRDFERYVDAWNFLVKLLKEGEIHDAALSCKVKEFGRPMLRTPGQKARPWEGLPDGHRWCGYCRRPVVFAYFRKHHALVHVAGHMSGKPMVLQGYVRRCSICGASERFLRYGK